LRAAFGKFSKRYQYDFGFARRWGKTSLVRKVSQLAQSDRRKIVLIDAFACRSEDDFYRLFAVEIIK